MKYAINYIGHYVLPPDWVDHAEEVTCTSGRRQVQTRASVDDIALHATCDSGNTLELRIDVAGNAIQDGVGAVR